MKERKKKKWLLSDDVAQNVGGDFGGWREADIVPDGIRGRTAITWQAAGGGEVRG